MTDITAIRNVVGIIGIIISLGALLSPMPTFSTIIKKKDVEQFSPIPYLVTFLNCCIWVFYGMPFVKPNSSLVVIINGIGIVVECVFLSIFLVYASNKGRVKAIKIWVVEIVFFVALVVLVMVFVPKPEMRASIVGVLAIILNVGMYASPLSVMKLVIQTKSVQYLPFWLCLAGFVNGICWFTYGLLPFDINLAIPNGLGALAGLVQLLLIAIYYKSTPKTTKPQKIDMEM